MQAQVWHCPCSLKALACLGDGCVAHVARRLSSLSFLPVLIRPCFLQLLPLALLTFILLVPDFFFFPLPPPPALQPSCPTFSVAAYASSFPLHLLLPTPFTSLPLWLDLILCGTAGAKTKLLASTHCSFSFPLLELVVFIACHFMFLLPFSFALAPPFFCRTTMFGVFALHKLIAMALSKWRAHEVLNDVLRYVTP